MTDHTPAPLDAPELSPVRLATLTSKFVSVPSVNGENPEGDLAAVIARELESSGFETVLVGSETRPSLAARRGRDPVVLLNGHLDTVPVDDASKWRVDPFSGVVEAGAVHGRGACDMKGGLAIQVAVAQWLAAHGQADGLVLHFAMGEERGEPGTEDLLAAGFVAPRGVVLEPTDLQLGVAQRGLITLRITIAGRGGHASRPALTDNPIARLDPVLREIERLDGHRESSHPFLGAPQWTPTMIHA
ncbi:MAG: M20/M25/M40 family metallo-hydrolase, partial [Acidimicrobiia bacterium]